MWAAADGYIQATQILLASGADINLLNQAGYTALAIAEFNGYQKIIKMLKQAGG